MAQQDDRLDAELDRFFAACAMIAQWHRQHPSVPVPKPAIDEFVESYEGVTMIHRLTLTPDRSHIVIEGDGERVEFKVRSSTVHDHDILGGGAYEHVPAVMHHRRAFVVPSPETVYGLSIVWDDFSHSSNTHDLLHPAARNEFTEQPTHVEVAVVHVLAGVIEEPLSYLPVDAIAPMLRYLGEGPPLTTVRDDWPMTLLRNVAIIASRG